MGHLKLLLQVTFETAEEPDATTSATIVLELHGAEGIAGPLDFDNSQTPLERNSATSFAVEGKAVGELEKLVVTLEPPPVRVAATQHNKDVPWLQLRTVASPPPARWRASSWTCWGADALTSHLGIGSAFESGTFAGFRPTLFVCSYDCGQASVTAGEAWATAGDA